VSAEPLPPGDVQPLPLADHEQQIEVLNPGASQHLSHAEPELTEQEVGVPKAKTPAQRAASATGKVVLGVLAAGIAIAAGAASLLLL
jgi:hypothetical protein